MPQSAGTTAAAVDALPDSGHARRPWWRRLCVATSAAALVGAMMASGGAVTPAPVKGNQSAFVSGDVVLEVDADLAAAAGLAGSSAGLGSGMTLVSRSLPVMKNNPVDLADAAAPDEVPVCISSPIEPGKFRLTSPYGYRTHPIFGTYTMHTGTDFAAPLGTPIHAVTDGTVVYTGAGRLGRSSELVIIEHQVEGTTFYSWYVHMYRDGIFVETGQQVRSGEIIAEVGNNGNSTGPHLHFEIHTSDAGLGLGLQKNSGARFTSSLLTLLVPTAEETPTDEESEDTTDGESEDPTDGESEDPTDGESEDPTDGESEDPTDGESEDPTDGESEDPTDGETETPSDGPPAPSPSPSETPSPTPSPSETPSETETPTDEESEDETEDETEDPDEDAEEEDEHSPFPTRAYGTTVEAVSFFASLGLTMVAPSACLPTRAR